MKSTATDLGKVNITVKATIDNKVKGCTKVAAGEGYADSLVKPLNVKPEGFPVEKVESDFKCLEDKKADTFSLPELELPSNLVKESERAWVEVSIEGISLGETSSTICPRSQEMSWPQLWRMLEG